MSGDDRKCQRCGSDVETGAMFCSRCGQDMTLVGDDTPTLAVTTAGTPVQPVRSTMRQALREATLGEYEILSELGRGGMATVFLAHDIALDRKVAIKVMAPHLLEGEGMAERFKLEARTAAQLSHPHIIPIYAVKETAETLYFVMKYVEGRGLDEVLKKSGQLPIPMVKDVLTKVGGALGYAHRRDVVHRDIKPANIMIDEEGQPVVTDFGIAKVSETKGLTQTGTTIGTPSYMSPEQCEAKPVTGASDQYSLGVVAFEMLTGKLPFEGDSVVNTMYKHCHEPLPPLEDFRPDCPVELRETVERMVAKDPSERWPTLEAAVRKLNNESTPTSVDPIRSQLLELVKEGGGTEELLARLSDPSGPVPQRSTGGRAEAPARSRAGMVAAVAALLVAGGAAAVLQPWAQDTPIAGATAMPNGGAAPAAVQPAVSDPGPSVQPAGGGPEPASGGAVPDAVGGAPAGDPGTTGTSPAAEPTGRGQQGRGGIPPAGRGAAAGQPTVQSVMITGAPPSLQPGQSAVLAARPLDAGGIVVSAAVGGIRWASSNEGVARVSPDGRVEAVAPGSVGITATAGGRSATVELVVAEAAVSAVVASPPSLELALGEGASVSAETRGADGSPLPGRSVAWQSSAPAVASVSATGQVSAVGPGTATLTASSGGASGTVAVTVRVPTRAAVEAVVTAYAEALESRDVARVRGVYPGLTAELEQTLQNSLPAMEGLAVDWVIQSVNEQGQTAVADVQATYRFRANGRATEAPVSLIFSFARTATGWDLSRIQNR